MILSKKKLLIGICLILIVSFSLLIRVYKLSSIPLGFHIDEASLGYNGYSLLLTGKDENNQKLPLYIDMFGDNRPSGYHYLTEIPIKFLSLNEFSTRFPGAIFGTLTVVSFFFLAQLLFKSKKVSLISSFLLAIASWHVVLSRASAETIVSLFFIISGFVLLLFSLQKQKPIYCFAAAATLSISFFFYHTSRVFVPLLFFVSILYLYPTWIKSRKKYKISLLLSFFILSFISFSLVFLIKGGAGRFSQVNIFSYPEVKLVLEEQIREDGISKAPVFLTRAFHNKVINYSLTFASNYFDYFSGKFLFVQGGLPNWYKVPGLGLIYIVELPFILIGLFYLFFSKNRYHKFPLIWLILAPVTAAFTVDDTPNIQRAIVMFPMIELIAAYGFVIFTNRFKDFKYKAAVVFFALLLIMNFSYFLHQYFVHSLVHRSWHRNEGFGQMVNLIKKDYARYDKIIVTKSFGGIYSLILFYMKYDPSQYQKEGSSKDKDNTGFGKFFFTTSACPSIDRNPNFPKVEKAIYVDNGSCPEYKSLINKEYTYVTRKDGTRVFRIVYE